MKKVAIIGKSISGNLTAAYLKHEHPELEIYIVGPKEQRQPIVGESLTEFSTHLLHKLGLGSYLEEEQYHKYGLTFYFKENIEDPGDRTYAMHEALAIPPLPSNQLNRFSFDKHLCTLNRTRGVHFIDGKVSDVLINPNGSHTLTVKRDDNLGTAALKADWVIDTSGRSRILATKLSLQQKPTFQRSVFWLRLVNFDESILANINAVKPEQCAFDSYFATHHFLGRGNWIWCIPMRSDEHRNMISIGIVWRPDIYPATPNTAQKFIAEVAKEHPVVSELVSSGEAFDTSFYSNYMYEASQVYSPDRWFLVGDAGDTVDPLYSTGVVMTSLQITQISEMIRASKNAALDDSSVKEFEQVYKVIRNTVQHEIGTLYEVMHDPYQSHWRMHLISAYYFFFLLPSWLAGYMSDSKTARWLRMEIENGGSDYLSLLSLLKPGSERLGRLRAQKITNRYKKTVNWNLWRPAEREISKHYSHLFFLYASYRFILLRNAGWQDWPLHCKAILRGVFRGTWIRLFYWNCPMVRKLKLNNSVVPLHVASKVAKDENLRHVATG